jgi:hypothetical protein
MKPMKRTLGWLFYIAGWIWLLGSALVAINPNVHPDVRLGAGLGGLCGGGSFIGVGVSFLLSARRARYEAAMRAWAAINTDRPPASSAPESGPLPPSAP